MRTVDDTLRDFAASDALAVLDPDVALSHRDLNAFADRIAAAISQRVPAGSTVALMLARTHLIVPAMVGVWRAGCAYVPLDPSHPRERLEMILLDSRAACVLSTSDLPARAFEATVIDLDIDDLPEARAQHVDPEAPAYVIYTSGSTGVPKGVVVSHGALANMVASFIDELAMTAADRALAVTTWSFDIAALELFVPLCAGGSVDIADERTVLSGARVSEHRVTLLQTTPSLWRLWIETGLSVPSTVRALCGGEALPAPLAAELRRRFTNVWNVYGPTETTVWSTAGRLQETVTLGEPIAHTRLYVWDEERRDVNEGELYIAGRGVALGYHDRQELTAERFLPDPYVPGERMFRTGDFVRHTADGLVFLGRRDGQVKLNGHRIELGEIESAAEHVPGVSAAVAVLAGAHLALCYAGNASAEAVRAELVARLPQPMWPRDVVPVATFPMTANGKLDRMRFRAEWKP